MTTEEEYPDGDAWWYIAVCLTCDPDRTSPTPFRSLRERGRWCTAHTKGTGHFNWMIFDQSPNRKMTAMSNEFPVMLGSDNERHNTTLFGDTSCGAEDMWGDDGELFDLVGTGEPVVTCPACLDNHEEIAT